MIRTHVIRLYPNNKQATYLSKCICAARCAYNWALLRWEKVVKQGGNITEGELRKELNAIKKEKFPWMYEVTKCAPQLAIRNDFNSAVRNYQMNRARKPKFRKKGERERFGISNDQFSIIGRKVILPHIRGVRLAEYLRFDGKILGASIKREDGKYYIAICVKLLQKKCEIFQK